MRNKPILITALLSATYLIAPAQAFAACPGTVTIAEGPCTLGAGQSVTINSGGSLVNGGGNAINIGNNAAGSINNSGTINGSAGGIRQTGPVGGATTITNQAGGTIIAGSHAIDIDDGIITNGIVNNGTLTAGASGLRMFKATIQNGGVTLGTTSYITGTTGVEFVSGGAPNEQMQVTGDLFNHGYIDVSAYGILFNSAQLTGDIVNSETGTIMAGTNGIWLATYNNPAAPSSVDDIINNGTITTTNNGDTILVESSHVLGRIDNQGTLTSVESGIRVTDSTVAEGIINKGTIDAGNYGIIVADGSVVTGDVRNNNTINSGLAGIMATLNSQIDGSILNNGEIHAASGVGISAQSDVVITGDVINNGSIIADTSSGILAYNSTIGGVIRNAANASITVNDVGNGAILLLGSSTTVGGIENFGTLTANDGTGIGVVNGATVTGDIINTGTITGTGFYADDGGIVVSDSTVGAIRNETNSSSIIGSLDGIAIIGSTVSGGILNNGTIRGVNSDGIHVGTSNFTGNIENNHLIFAYSDGIDFGEGAPASSLDGSIINGVNGVITADDNGIELGSSQSVSTITGSIINNGQIIAASNGIDTDNIIIMGDITNNNRIQGGEIGLAMEDTRVDGVITNAAGAYIGGSDYAVLIYTPTSRITFNNYGELDGAIVIEDTTLNLEEGSIASGAIGGNGGIVNIKTDIATAEEYGPIGGTLDEINIASGKTFTSQRGSDTLFDTFIFNNDGTFKLVGNPNNSVVATVFWDYAQTADGIFSFDAQSPTIFSSLNVQFVADFAPDTGIHVNITGNEFDFAGGVQMNDVISAGTLNASTFTVTDNSYLYNFTAILDGDTVDLQSIIDNTHSLQAAVNQDGNNPASGAANAMNQIIAQGPVGDMQAVVNALASLTTAQELKEAMTQTLPTLTGGSTTAVLQNMGTTGQIIQARQSQVTGLSSGDGIIGDDHVWVKPFGTWSNQGTDKGVVGYDADTYGFIAGADGAVSDDVRLGVALSYAKTDLESNNALNKMDVDSYQAMMYGSYAINAKTEANFQLGGGYNQADSTRIVNFAGLNRVADADIDGYAAQVGVGIGYSIDIAAGTTVTPSVRVDYDLVHNRSYTETGAGGLNLNVKSQTTDQLTPSLSAKLDHEFGNGFSASANAGVGYNVLNEQSSVVASYVGGGSAFVTNGLKPSPWVVRTGAGLSYNATDDLDLTIRYDREDRGEFDSQTASIRVRKTF